MQVLAPLAWLTVAGATGYQVNLVSYVGTAWSETAVTSVPASAFGPNVQPSCYVPTQEGVPAVYTIRAQNALGVVDTQSDYYLDTPCLGWLRKNVRTNLQDLQALKFPDPELDMYIREAMREYSKHFPRQAEMDIAAVALQTSYPLPDDIVGDRISLINWQRYPSWEGGFGAFRDEYYLRKKPYHGGESPPQTLYTWPKLAVGVIRRTSRYYTGHYWVWNGQLHIDIVPQGTENMHVTYEAQQELPQTDPDLFSIPADDLEILSLYVRAKCAVRIEAQDTGLSRWRTKEDGSRRDDSPVPGWSTRLFNAFEQRIREKKLMTPKTGRLTRV